MPKLSPQRELIRKKTIKEAIKLRKQGYSLKDIGRILGKSHEWVRQMLSTPL